MRVLKPMSRLDEAVKTRLDSIDIKAFIKEKHFKN